MTSTGRRQTYEHGSLRVTYDPAQCIHAAACVRGLPAVFRPKERRWVQLEHADEAAIRATVAQCPSGALQAERIDAIPSAPAATEPVEITLSRGGPLLIAGPVVIKQADGTVVASPTKAALCRCGHTANAPFCDGSHARVGFSPSR